MSCVMGDAVEATFYQVARTASARKHHRCESCGRTILVTEPMVRIRWFCRYDGWGCVKLCTRCWELYPETMDRYWEYTRELLPWVSTWCAHQMDSEK